MTNMFIVAGGFIIAQLVLGAVGLWFISTKWYMKLVNKITEKVCNGIFDDED